MTAVTADARADAVAASTAVTRSATDASRWRGATS